MLPRKKKIKPPTYNPREEYVLEKPKGYRVKVFQDRKWQTAPYLYTAADAKMVLDRLRAAGYKTIVYAARDYDGDEWMACVNESFLTPLVKD